MAKMKNPDSIPFNFRINKEILTRREGEEMLLFDPRRRKIHLFSSLTYRAWVSLKRIKNLSSFMKNNQLGPEEARYVLSYFLKERLIIETKTFSPNRRRF